METKLFRTKFLFLLLLFSAGSLLAHWTTKGPYGGKVKCMAVSDTLIYVGTFDGGVYRTTNSLVTTWRYANYTGLTNPGINALTCIGNKVIAGTNTGVFRSTDIGNTWLAKNSGLSSTNVLALITAGDHVLAGTNGGGIYLSHDSAGTWIQSNPGLTNMTVTAFAYDGTNIYAGTSGGGVFVSTDDGDNWSAMNMNLGNMTIKTLAVSGGQLFAGTNNGVYMTNTSTVNWSQVNSGLSNTFINGLTAAGGVIYASTNAGVFSSPDSSPAWSAANNGFTDTVNVTAVFSGKIIAGTQSWGLYKSTSLSSISWAKFNTGFNNLKTHAIYNSGQLVIAATEKGFFVSRDLAATYVASNTGLTDSLHVKCLTWWGTKLFVGTQFGGVFMSADTGKTWTTANTSLGNMNIAKIVCMGNNLIAAAADGNVYMSSAGSIGWMATMGTPAGIIPTSLASNGSMAFLSTQANGVYKTNDAMSWSTFNTGLTNMNVTSLVIKGTDIYAATMGAGIFKSGISSSSWVTVNNGLPTMNILSLATAGTWVAAGYKGGVHASFDDGTNWSPTNVILYIPEYADVKDLSFTSASTRIFAGTPANSLYSNATTELPAVGIKEYAADANILFISPNPNNGEFVIQSKINEVQIAEVIVYDNLGRIVCRETPQEMGRIKFKTVPVPGIYYVKAFTGKVIMSTRLIIQ